MLFSRPSKSVGIDIGSHSVKAVQMSKSGGRFRIDQVGYSVVDRNQVNVDPVAAQASAVREALRAIPTAQSLLVGALPAQTVVIRYPRLPDMPSNEIDQAVQNEAGQNIPYDLEEVWLDWALLDTVSEGEKKLLKILLVAAKHEQIESRVQIAQSAEIEYSILGVDSLALADAAECCDFLGAEESVALVNLGASSTSIHFTKDGISNFIRDVSWGARDLVQAISKARRCEYAEAEQALINSRDEESAVPFNAPSPAEEKPAPAKTPKGGSLLDPLEDELGSLGDIGSAGAAPSIGQKSDQEKSLNEILAQPMARLVAEIRRSFDYYEQQLYEHHVERIILSGGIAHLPIVKNTLVEELGLEHIEVANPASSALHLGPSHAVAKLVDHPAQFMVALGLAARGMADL
ncbi:MAG: type IV pilus assembly protein PilM [Candidatus Hydrogenedentes bacterium]|nr:type IV pilus assembly protein PilM [Candidatus Hydrogenedentota bacterium]